MTIIHVPHVHAYVQLDFLSILFIYRIYDSMILWKLEQQILSGCYGGKGYFEKQCKIVQCYIVQLDCYPSAKQLD